MAPIASDFTLTRTTYPAKIAAMMFSYRALSDGRAASAGGAQPSKRPSRVPSPLAVGGGCRQACQLLNLHNFT